VEIPRVTSDCDARQDEHVLAELGAMGIPHIQQRMLTILPGSTGWMGGACIFVYSFGFLVLTVNSIAPENSRGCCYVLSSLVYAV